MNDHNEVKSQKKELDPDLSFTGYLDYNTAWDLDEGASDVGTMAVFDLEASYIPPVCEADGGKRQPICEAGYHGTYVVVDPQRVSWSGEGVLVPLDKSPDFLFDSDEAEYSFHEFFSKWKNVEEPISIFLLHRCTDYSSYQSMALIGPDNNFLLYPNSGGVMPFFTQTNSIRHLYDKHISSHGALGKADLNAAFCEAVRCACRVALTRMDIEAKEILLIAIFD